MLPPRHKVIVLRSGNDNDFSILPMRVEIVHKRKHRYYNINFLNPYYCITRFSIRFVQNYKKFLKKTGCETRMKQ